MRAFILLFACLALSLAAADVGAHSGGLNSEGCHTNRKTGDHHCHRGGGAGTAPRAAPSPPLPLRDAALRDNAPLRGTRSPDGVFRNCSEARAAGAPPVRRGDSGYGPHLDRDGDGIGCER